MVDISAILASAVLAGLAIFQFALILGAPLGRFAWGGKHDVLPTNLRVSSMSSIFLYGIFSIIILAKAGIVSVPISDGAVVVTMWVLTGYFFVGVAMNAISRSKPERYLMTPVAAVLALLFLLVALN